MGFLFDATDSLVGIGMKVLPMVLIVGMPWAQRQHQQEIQLSQLRKIFEHGRSSHSILQERQRAAGDRVARLGFKTAAAMQAARREWPSSYVDNGLKINLRDPWFTYNIFPEGDFTGAQKRRDPNLKYTARTLTDTAHLTDDVDQYLKIASRIASEKGAHLVSSIRTSPPDSPYVMYQATKCLQDSLCANSLAGNPEIARKALALYTNLAAKLSQRAAAPRKAEICGTHALMLRDLAYIGFPGVVLNQAVETLERCAALAGYSETKYFGGAALSAQLPFAQKAIAAYARSL